MKPRLIITYLLSFYNFAGIYLSGQLVINEFMASNVTSQINPQKSDFVDWIELFNAGDSAVSLSDLFLTDDLEFPLAWPLPSEVVIEPGSYYIIWADGLGNHNHAPFKLNGKGEQIGLFSREGVVIDTVSFAYQPDDISFGRYPDGDGQWYYFAEHTCGSSNSSPGFGSRNEASPPAFSPEGGKYESLQMIELSSTAGEVYYTLDGSVPTPQSFKYSGPIQISGTSVLRARAFQDHKLPSRTVTHTYIIDESAALPVISITTPPEFLFDEEIGITPGICVSDELGAPPPFDPNANFWNNWERPVHIELFTPEGVLGLKQDAGIAIFGGFFGRQIRQKSFTIYARDKYGDADFDFPFFPSKSLSSFQRFILRASANDFNMTFLRCAMMNSLVIGQMDIDYQAYQPAVLYINGVFWGLYNIREKMNQYYPESNYGIESDRVDLLEKTGETANGDGTHYHQLIDFVRQNPIDDPENYAYVKERMDMVEFMNYLITEIYVDNQDWLVQNIKWWREHSATGKWRWMLYDLDWGFSGEIRMGTEQYNHNTLEWVLGMDEASFLFRRLLENETFRAEFAQRFVTHLILTFNPERVHQIISGMAERITPEMPRHIERWGAIQSMEYWLEQLEVLHRFAQERPYHMANHLSEILMPEEKREFILEVSDIQAGWISVFQVPCPPPLTVGQWYMNIPIEVEAHSNPGWRFVRWEGASESSEDEITIILHDNAYLNAVFEPREEYSIVISEIHYNPSSELQGDDDDFEFLELVNTEETRIELSGYHFTRGIEFTFPTGSYMNSGEYIILARNADIYKDKSVRVFQITDGRLDNAGEELVLSDNEGNTVDRVCYDDHYPWPREADGTGPSLELRDMNLDNSLASSWTISDMIGGTPGTVNIINDHRIQLSLQAWPNPFNYSIFMKYELPAKGLARIRVFNLFGKEIKQLVSEIQEPGAHIISWEPGDLPSGVYLIHVSQGGYSYSEKVLYLNQCR